MREASDTDKARRAARRALLQIALRRARPGTGSSAPFLERRTAVQPVPDLHTVLGDRPWALVGGLALRAYMPERQTQDVDILIDAEDEALVRRRFADAGFRVTGDLSIGGFSVALDDASPPVDVLVADQPWLRAALRRPEHDPVGLPVVPRPELIVMKLLSARARDLGDVQGLLGGITPAEVERVQALLNGIDPELIQDFEALRHLARLEFGSG